MLALRYVLPVEDEAGRDTPEPDEALLTPVDVVEEPLVTPAERCAEEWFPAVRTAALAVREAVDMREAGAALLTVLLETTADWPPVRTTLPIPVRGEPAPLPGSERVSIGRMWSRPEIQCPPPP